MKTPKRIQLFPLVTQQQKRNTPSERALSPTLSPSLACCAGKKCAHKSMQQKLLTACKVLPLDGVDYAYDWVEGGRCIVCVCVHVCVMEMGLRCYSICTRINRNQIARRTMTTAMAMAMPLSLALAIKASGMQKGHSYLYALIAKAMQHKHTHTHAQPIHILIEK